MKFRDLFKIQPEQMLPDRERVRKQVFKRRSRKVSIITCSISACAVLVVAAVCVLAVFSQPKEPEKILLTDSINIIEHIEPTQTGALGMSVQSDLKVTTTQNVTPSELKARMAITPEADYDVKRIGPQEYELRFEEDLAANTLYKVAAVYEENIVYRWAFQTESVFCITGATPQNETHVGVDTPVEITFSHADVSGFENAFQITPAVKGTFEHYGRTWAFVPSAPFEEATFYTVTIQKGITGPEGAALEEDLTFSFTTAPVNSYAYLLYQQNEAADTFLVDERPIAAICYENINFSKVNVKVYPFADAEAYRAAYGEYVRNGAVSGEIMALAEEPHAQFDATPIRAENYNGIYDHAAFINYPEALPQGYYFAEITVGSRKLYQLLQSTTLSVYTITVNGDYTVWVNDAISGEAAGGRVVSLEGFNEKETNDMGIVSFAGNKEAAQSRALLIENGAYPYVAFLDGNIADENIKQQNRYFSYLSTNSRLYRNGDTVGLFGVVLPRTANADLPDEVTLEWDFSDEEFQVEVEKNGSFTAELSLGNTALTSGNIRLMMGETCLYETYIYIADYELPTYYVTLTTDRLVYEAGETGIVSALVTYMDETPAPQIPLSIGNGIITGTTDENGRLTGTFIAEGYEDEYYTDTAVPQVHYISGNVENGTDVYYGGEVAYMVVTEPYLLEGFYADGTLSVQADTVSYAKADQLDEEHLYEEESVELLRGNGATLELTGELHRITYKKTPNGTTYDPIHKRVVYTWDYEEQDELVRTIELKAEEGSGELKIPESADEDAFYYVLLSHAESEEPIRVDLHEPYSYDGGSRAYDLSADQTTVQIGDTVNLTVRDGTNHELVNSGSTVYTVVSGGIVSNHHSISARLALTFKKEYAPDICVYGAYFDGKHVYSLGYEYLNYDQSNAEVQIQMEKDQLQYRPGDEVTLTFHVTDPEGKPVETALNISVMDRALHLIGGGNLETPAEGFFRSRCFSTPVYITCSHREFGMGTVIGGGGGGDGDPLRSDFEDTPFFKTVETDKNGKATVTFTLPDTITEWKVLARTISPELLVGNETFELVSTQDYFAGVSMAETLKADDEVTIGVKGDGRKTPADAICNFTVGITDRDGNEIQTLTATAPKSQYAYLNFGQLEAGVYTAYIQTSCGELEDSVIRSFTVEDSQSTVWIHHQQEVAGSVFLSLIPQKGNVTLTIVDEQKAFWQKAMARLRAGGGERVDQVLGQYLAEQYYADGIWMNPETLDHAAILSYMDYDGVKLLPTSSSDLKLSAKLAAVAPAFCDQEILRDAFEQYLNNRYAARVDVMTAYFGLAALGEPVLADLQALCLSVSDFTAEEYAYLALGLAYCGDYDTAAYLYETHLKSLLAEENGMIYAEEEDLTGCCALLANRLNLPASEGLMQYILETDTETTLLHLELISYLNDHAVDTVGENTVTVSLGDGSNQTYTYSKTGQLVLLLNEKQAENIRIMNGSGNSYVSYAYRGTPDALAQLGEALPLAGTEIPAAVARGETAIIQLHVEIPADFEGATLDCTLPAGLRLESGTVACGNMEYGIYSPYHSRVISTALPEGSCVITLEVRGALPGNYMLEPITVTHAGDHRYMATSPAVVSVVS